MTIQLPLSAFLMVRSLFLLKQSKLCFSCMVRLGCVSGMGVEESASLVREMYCSSLGLEAGGRFQSDLPLNGCLGVGGGL